MKQLKIVAECSVPYIKGVAEELGEVTYLPSEEFTPEVVKEADWLIIRSTTKCNRALLEHSKVQLITSATIGFDHIDTHFCHEAGITWYNSPGCNAEAVAQYFTTAIALRAIECGWDPRGKVIGVVGVGNVGRRVARNAHALGMEVLLNDPPRARAEGSDAFVSLQEIVEKADVIAFHVPLIKEGEDRTVHLLDDRLVNLLQRKPIIMNACRGPVTDTSALLRGLREGKITDTIIDCWEGEPNISQELLKHTWLGTPHIAGFSAQGKANGARTCIEHGLEHFGLKLSSSEPLYPTPLSSPLLQLSSNLPLWEALLKTFDIRGVDRTLRERSKEFETLRREYHYPYEPSEYQLRRSEIGECVEAAQGIGFQIID